MKQTRKRGLWVSMITFIITAILALYAAAQLDPEAQVPVHWGADGADQFADAATAAKYLWIIPGVTIFSALLFAFIPFLEPLKDNLEKSGKAYGAVWISTAILYPLIQLGIVGGMLGWMGDGTEMVRWVIAATSVMFILIGNYLPKTRANFFFGIRTPWTLTSDTSWEKTHRLGGRMLMLVGFVGLVGAFILKGLMLALFMPGLLLPIVFILIIYSFLVWRKADDRNAASDYIV